MDNLSRSGRGNAPKHYDSDSSSQNEDPGPESAPLRQSSDGTKGSSSSSGKQQKQEHKAPWMNARPLPPQPNTTSLDWVPPNPFAQDAPEDPTAPKEKIQTTLDNIPLVTTSTVTTTITAPVAPPASNLMTVVSRSKTNNAKGKLAEASVASPKVPGLNLTKSLTTVTAPDPTETPKSSRTARGQKNSSQLLGMDGGTLRAMGKGKTDLRLPEFSKSSKTSLPKSESLAAQLVIGESRWFQDPLGTDKARTMLRGGISMRHPAPTDQKQREEENAIEQLLIPFIRHHIKQSRIPEYLEHIRTEYENSIADKAVAAFRKLRDEGKADPGKGSSVVNDPALKKLIEPLIQPLIDFIKGKHGELKTWGYPAPILNLLVHLSFWTKKWHEANSTLDAESFKTAQMNALKSFASTRSFMTDFTTDLQKTKERGLGDNQGARQMKSDKDEDYYRPLLAFMNTAVTKAIESLLNELIGASAEKTTLMQRMADVVESTAQKSDAENERLLDESRDKVLARKPKLMTQIKDTIAGRGKEETPKSPRPRLRRAGTLNAKAPASRGEMPTVAQTQRDEGASAFTEAAVREANKIRKRKANFDAYVQELKSKVFEGRIDTKAFREWSDIVRGFTKNLAEYSREEYNTFVNNRHKVFLDFLNELVTNNSRHDQTPTDDLWALIHYLENQVARQDKQLAKEKETS